MTTQGRRIHPKRRQRVALRKHDAGLVHLVCVSRDEFVTIAQPLSIPSGKRPPLPMQGPGVPMAD